MPEQEKSAKSAWLPWLFASIATAIYIGDYALLTGPHFQARPVLLSVGVLPAADLGGGWARPASRGHGRRAGRLAACREPLEWTGGLVAPETVLIVVVVEHRHPFEGPAVGL